MLAGSPQVAKALQADSSEEWVRLERQAALRLPAGFVPLGVTGLRSNLIAAWSRDRIVVFENGTSRLIDPKLPGSIVSVAFRDVRTADILTTNPNAVARLAVGPMIDNSAIAGSAKGIRSLPVHVLSATLVDSTWYIAGLDAAERVGVYRVGSGVTARRLVTLPAKARPEGEPETYHITANGHRIVLTALHQPFEVLVWDGDDVERLPFPRLPEASNDGSWISLPVIALSKELYLRTISDLTSDRRLLQLLSGEMTRAVRLELPLALTHSIVGTCYMLATLQGVAAEVLLFRWTAVNVSSDSTARCSDDRH